MARIDDEVTYWCRKYGTLNLAQVIRGAMDWAQSDANNRADTLARELAAKNERLEYLEGQDRSLLEQHQASMITLGDSDLLAVGGRLLARAEKAEHDLSGSQALEAQNIAALQSANAELARLRLLVYEAEHEVEHSADCECKFCVGVLALKKATP